MLDSTAAQAHCDAVIETLASEPSLDLSSGLDGLRLLKELGAEKDVLSKAADKMRTRFPEAKVVDRVIEGEFQ